MNKWHLLIFVFFFTCISHAQVNHYDRPADAVFNNTYSGLDITNMTQIVIYQSAVHQANLKYLRGMIDFVNITLRNDLDEELRKELTGINKGMNVVMDGIVYDGKKLFSNVTDILIGTNRDINKAIDNYNLRQKMKEESARKKREKERIEERKPKVWSGSGFALNEELVVTNCHVVEGAKDFTIQGVNGDFNQQYNATIVTLDRENDIAVLRIKDSRFKGFGRIPYRIKTTSSEVGEDVFVLGYPLTATMGDEIKLTTGVISSQTGYQGIVSLYQISAPIQPGNSGGPLFDKQGNLIGIISAKHKDAENVGYAIKIVYLKKILESIMGSTVFPNNNQVSGMTLSGKVKILKNFVYMIKCSDQQSSLDNRNSNNIHKFKSDNINVIEPQISIIPSSNMGLKIKRVQVTLAQTIIDLEFDNYVNKSGWISVDPNTYIVSFDTGKKYKIVKVEGISMEPQKYYLTSIYEKVDFRLIFPALPKNTTKFNLIENEVSTWKFYGIKLQ